MIEEDEKELKYPKCDKQCNGWYESYADPTGVYPNGNVEDILVDKRTDMFIKRLLGFIKESKAECNDYKQLYKELALAAASPKNV